MLDAGNQQMARRLYHMCHLDGAESLDPQKIVLYSPES